MAVLRCIRRIRSVELTVNSPTHRSGPVLEPGKWEEHDPFFAADGRHFFSAAPSRNTPIAGSRRLLT